MKTVVIGAGGVGLALGSCLHASGHPVHFVVKNGDAPHPLEREGLTRRGIFGSVVVPGAEIAVTRSIFELEGSAPDFVLVCTKTTAVPEVADGLGTVWPALDSEPTIVLCQNGWGSAERFAASLPRDRIYNARVITGFSRRSPSSVDVTVHAEAIHIGSLFGEPPERAEKLAAAIDTGGIPCRTTPDIEADLLAKLLYNCLLNPLGALAGVPYGVLAESAETRRIMETVAHEIFAVLDASERRTHWTSADAYLETFYRDLLPPTAEHESSMLQDLAAGRPTEIDALSGAVVRMASAEDIDAPVNLALTSLVHAAERRERENDQD